MDVFHRTPFNYDTDQASRDTGLTCPEPTRTQQQFKDDSDINVLFARYLETGEMPQLQDGLAYGDFTGIFDYQTAMNEVRHAQALFEQLPARIKNRFDNDPGKLLNYLNDTSNREEAEFLGLLQKPVIRSETSQPATPTGDTNGRASEQTPGSGTQTPAQPSGTGGSPQTAPNAQKP